MVFELRNWGERRFGNMPHSSGQFRGQKNRKRRVSSQRVSERRLTNVVWGRVQKRCGERPTRVSGRSVVTPVPLVTFETSSWRVWRREW